MEEWRDVVGYEGLYQVSNTGKVRSLDRYARVCGGGQRLVKGKEIAINKYSNGYSFVMIGKNKYYTSRLVHRLVAQAFIPNPNNLPQVNHKDENIENNEVSNLEWCTASYNANYGTRNKRCYESNRKHFKPVYQMDKDCGKIIKRWDSIANAARFVKCHEEEITRVCKGRYKTAGGFRWMYANDCDKEIAI